MVLFMNNYVFFFKKVMVGGAEFLIEKLARELIIRGNDAYVICEDIYDEMYKRFLKNSIKIFVLKKWNINSVEKVLCQINRPVCITFEWDIFLKIFLLKIAEKKTIFYSIDYKILSFGEHRKESLLKSIEKKLSAGALKSMIRRNIVIAQDEQTIRYNKTYFGKLLNIDDLKIIRIPVDVPGENNNMLDKDLNGNFGILSIARADFPFKAYLLGLVRLIPDLNPSVTLTIVSYGKDLERLQNEIDKLGDQKFRIKLFGKMDYDSLNSLFEESKLYIGMGTTVIDAAIRGVISIPVVAHTEKVIAYNYFHEDFRSIAVDEKSNNKIIQLIEDVLEMNDDDYSKYATISRNLAIQNYGTQSITKQLIDFCDNAENDSFDIKIQLFCSLRRIVSFFSRSRRL